MISIFTDSRQSLVRYGLYSFMALFRLYNFARGDRIVGKNFIIYRPLWIRPSVFYVVRSVRLRGTVQKISQRRQNVR